MLENILIVSYLGFSSNILVISYAIMFMFASETLFIFLLRAFLISIAYSEFRSIKFSFLFTVGSWIDTDTTSYFDFKIGFTSTLFAYYLWFYYKFSCTFCYNLLLLF